jgi:hypothetical protein
MNKIELYKKGILSFNKKEEYKKYNTIDLEKHAENYDYIVGILFLTEMNRHCKENNFTIHGYYISQSLINIFIKITNSSLSINDITNFYYNLSTNVSYINDRSNISQEIKNKINMNYSKLIVEITPFINNLLSETSLNDFFYILLIISKYIGTGDAKNEPNLYKLAEYYAGIFNICTIVKKSHKLNQEIFDEYVNYKNKLKYSLEYIKINSERIDEILEYINEIIKFHFESKL